MRESVIDVLFYLFDDILPTQQTQETDFNQMAQWLSEAGFESEDVGRAIDWFYELTRLSDYKPSPSENKSIRIFASREKYYIDSEGQNYLYSLKSNGLLDDGLLEKVIERALALEEPLDVNTLRWVAAMVILNVYGENHEALNTYELQKEFFQPLNARTIN